MPTEFFDFEDFDFKVEATEDAATQPTQPEPEPTQLRHPDQQNAAHADQQQPLEFPCSHRESSARFADASEATKSITET